VTRVVAREGYALLHSSEDLIPVFVCQRIEPNTVGGAVNGSHLRFRADPELPEGERAVDEDYVHSGFDRGHMAPNADFAHDEALRRETFVLSNAVPQSPSLNGGRWAALEAQVRTWLGARGGWVVTGTLFYDPAEDDPQTADGWVPIQRIGTNQVVVPTHLFKIVVAEIDGRIEALGFVMANDHPGPDFQNSVESIDWIEAATGIDFMPQMGAQDVQRVESARGPVW
jgi:endonuclease G